MSQKKYYLRVWDKHGNLIFDHKSNYIYRLCRLYNKAAYDSAGNELAQYYLGKLKTNLPDWIKYAISDAEKI